MSAVVVGLIGAGLGLCFGSFANVVVWRIPRGESIVVPPSHCPSCDSELRWYDNIPVASWVALRGRCRSCATAISIRYPIVETLTALLWIAAVVRFGASVEVVPYAIFFTALVVLSAIDIDTQRVPNKVLYPAGALCAVALGIPAVADDRLGDLARAGIGAALGFGALFVIHTIKPNGLGFGDVRLAFLLGLMLGFQGLGFVAVGLFAGFLLGAVIGSAAIATGHGAFGRRIPFAPYLAAGAIVTVLFGRPVVDWYAGLL